MEDEKSPQVSPRDLERNGPPPEADEKVSEAQEEAVLETPEIETRDADTFLRDVVGNPARYLIDPRPETPALDVLANSTMTQIERAFKRGDLDDPNVQGRVEGIFNSAPDGAKAVIAQYIYDRQAAGDVLERAPYKEAVRENSLGGLGVPETVSKKPELSDDQQLRLSELGVLDATIKGTNAFLEQAVDSDMSEQRAALMAQMDEIKEQVIEGLDLENLPAGVDPEEIKEQALAQVEEAMMASFPDACSSLDNFDRPIDDVMRMIEANYAGVKSGDVQDLSKIDVDPDGILTPELRESIQDGLAKLEENINSIRDMQATCDSSLAPN